MSPDPLERLAALERAVAQLAARGPRRAENLVPTYLTVDPTTGAVSANFTGRVAASGIDFNTDDLEVYPYTNWSIRWHRTSDGAIASYIYSDEVGQVGLLLANQNPDIPAQGSNLQLAHHEINIGVGGITRRLLNDLGSSAFLQLATTAARKIDFGSASLTWTAAQQSAAATIPHGLGASPVAIAATLDTIGSGQVAFAVCGNRTTTQFQLVGWSPAAFSGTLACNWIAVG